MLSLEVRMRLATVTTTAYRMIHYLRPKHIKGAHIIERF